VRPGLLRYLKERMGILSAPLLPLRNLRFSSDSRAASFGAALAGQRVLPLLLPSECAPFSTLRCGASGLQFRKKRTGRVVPAREVSCKSVLSYLA
jgi:hypothetical protein